jgi:biotin transport system substrate-specific component
MTENNGLRHSRNRSIALCGLFIALFAVSAGISVPLGPVPFTLQTLVLVLAVCVLGPKEVCAATLGYLVLGAIGLPIYHGFTGGLGILLGPTGGFLFGYVVAGTLGAYLRIAVFHSKLPRIVGDAGGAVVAIVICYVFGWAQLMLVAHMGPLAAFAAGCAPFVLLDAIKAVVAVTIAHPIRAVLSREEQ